MMDQCDNVVIVDGKEYVIEYKNKNTASQDIRMLRVYAEPERICRVSSYSISNNDRMGKRNQDNARLCKRTDCL